MTGNSSNTSKATRNLSVRLTGCWVTFSRWAATSAGRDRLVPR